MKARAMARQALKLVSKRGVQPEYLTFFVTNRCNLRCAHCFYWAELNQDCRELTLDEIERIAKGMEPFFFLLLTGGEPFLRPDLDRVARVFYEKSGVRKLSIMTHGLHTDRVVEATRRILTDCPELRATVYHSIDGLREVHDRIRGLSGSFEHVVATFRALEKLRATEPRQIGGRLGLAVITTYNALNEGTITETYEWVRDELRPDTFNCPIVRGLPKDPGVRNVDVGAYERLMARVEDDLLAGRLPGVPDPIVSRIVLAAKLEATRNVIATARDNAYRTPCYAGQINAVLQPNGDVFPCELLEGRKLGNIRDADYDFRRVWSGELAEDARRFIKDTNCRCTHGCNAMPNVLFNPAWAPRVAWNALRLAVRPIRNLGLRRGSEASDQA